MDRRASGLFLDRLLIIAPSDILKRINPVAAHGFFASSAKQLANSSARGARPGGRRWIKEVPAWCRPPTGSNTCDRYCLTNVNGIAVVGLRWSCQYE